jgi:hypothetical protein
MIQLLTLSFLSSLRICLLSVFSTGINLKTLLWFWLILILPHLSKYKNIVPTARAIQSMNMRYPMPTITYTIKDGQWVSSLSKQTLSSSENAIRLPKITQTTWMFSMKLVSVRSYIILVRLLAFFGIVNAKIVPRLYKNSDNTLITANPIKKKERGSEHRCMSEPVMVSLVVMRVMENKSKNMPMKANTLYYLLSKSFITRLSYFCFLKSA